MAANDPATVTIDTDEMVYTDRHGHTHTVQNGETFVMSLANVDMKKSLNDSLLAWWKLDDNASSTEVLDQKGRSPGTLNGAEATSGLSTTGKLGNALDFTSASSEYVGCTHNDVINPEAFVTVEAWVNGSATGSTQRVITKRSTAFPNEAWVLSITTLDKPLFFVDGGDQFTVTGDTSVLDGTWYHLIGIRNGDTAIALYVNGVSEGTPSGTPTGSMGSAQAIEIGRDPVSGGSNYADVIIDNVRVFDRAISAAEIAFLYNGGSGILDLSASPQESLTGTKYNPTSGELALTTGEKLIFETDSSLSSFNVALDGSSESNAGSIWFRETDGYLAEWKIRDVKFDNNDEPTSIRLMNLERVDNPMITMALTTVTVSQ